MFSITCAGQNQLFSLSQFLSTITYRQNVASSRTLARPKKNACIELDISQAECHSPVSRLFADLPRNNVSNLLEQISPIHKQIKTKQSKFFESHVSANTFFENKCGFHERSLCTTPLVFNFQTRGFKTHRGEISLQGPTVTDRLRSKFQARRVAIGGIQTGFSKDRQKTLAEIEHNDKLSNLLSNEQLNTEEKSRMKVAFAEGYLAAKPQGKTSKTSKALRLIQTMLSIIVLILILQSFSGGGSIFRVSVGNGSEVSPEEIAVSFDDVKGVEEAKTELQEIVEFLKNPEKFSALGGKLPKGVLLVGPPGTGKTMLARAVAGEAGVPFFHAAGPEFDEVLVGQGARRVRDLFKAAKLRAPCVIFIDEIDSVGAKRTNSVLHPYANQTINQLLTEMDGFHQNEGVVVLGATNRRDDLDKALLRPGRFDVEVRVPIPDFAGRKEILDHYLRKIKLANDVDVESLARRTTGFTGADLENLVNQAALRGAIDGAPFVTMKHLEHARDRVLMGPERKSRIPDEEANLITAYHEGGHTIVAHFTKDASPLHKVTIIPRGQALGHTAFIPEKENYYVNKSQLLARIDVAMGGRAAEELIFGADKITAGAASDLKSATAIATYMVKEWGMSEKVGFRTHENEKNALMVVNDLSPHTAEVIDSEIKAILQDSYERAKTILRSHQQEHKMLAEALLKYETLDAEDVKSILNSTNSSSSSPEI